jgi:phenol 2-monooxygenase
MAPITKDAIDEVDILICGSGSAGICTAAYLSRCGVSCRILESRDAPVKVGRADGVQCRTVEVFESFGLAEDLLRESYHVIEDAFWSTSEHGGLIRTRVTGDTAKNLSHMPHVILNQARLHNFLIDAMKKWNGQEIEYGVKVVSLKVDGEAAMKDAESYAVSVTVEKNGRENVIRAKYVLVGR